MYLPGRFASTEEVIELAEVVAPFGGIYDSHTRDPVKDFLGSVKECIDIGEKSGARPHPAHLKAVGKKNWGKVKAVSDTIEGAIDKGLDVTCDQYPYDGAATARLIDVLVAPEGVTPGNMGEALRDPEKLEQIRQLTENPPSEVYSWVETVGYDSFRIEKSEKFPEYIGKMVVDIAAQKETDPFSLIVEILLEEGPGAGITLGGLSEEDVRFILTRPWTMIGSDGSTGWHTHPRAYGTFPRVLGRYVREWGVLSLEEAVHKMTALTADYFRLENVGRVEEGYRADITVFDPETVIDHSDWIHPMKMPEGIIHVFVNGVAALKDGEMTGELNGHFIPFKGGEYVKKPGF
jgi:N-acyl-D-aspartate/D-glutamate deacylase